MGERGKYFLNVRSFQISESQCAVNKKASTYRSGWRSMPRRHQRAETWFRELKKGTGPTRCGSAQHAGFGQLTGEQEEWWSAWSRRGSGGGGGGWEGLRASRGL